MHVWMLLGLIHKTPSDGWCFSTFPPPSLENTDHFKCWVQSNTLDLEHRTQTNKSYLGGDTTPASPTFFLVGFMVTPWHPSSTPTTSWPFEELQPLMLLSASTAQQEVTPLPLNPSLTSSDLPPALPWLLFVAFLPSCQKAVCLATNDSARCQLTPLVRIL